MPSISRDEVAHLARLARLELSADELDEYAGQLDSIVGYVAEITEVSAGEIPAMSHPSAVTNVLREDRREPSLTPAQALAQAPAAEADKFVVPRMLGE